MVLPQKMDQNQFLITLSAFKLNVSMGFKNAAP